MSESCDITYAIDLRDMKRKTPDEVYLEYQEKHFPLVCELCKGRVFPRCGEIRSHHFAHMHIDNPTELQMLCRESCERSGGTGPSEWHKNWQRLFSPELREKRCVHDKEIRKADILFKKYPIVIEFQKGEFGGRFHKDTCIKRNAFWNAMGKKIIWLFEDTDLRNEKITKAQDKPCFRIFTPYLMALFGDNVFDPDKIEVHIMYDGDAYRLYDFKACDNNITEAMFCRSFFNTYIDNIKKHPADVIPDIEERIYAEMNEVQEQMQAHFHPTPIAVILAVALSLMNTMVSVGNMIYSLHFVR